jgi:hypothetical protein
MWRIPLIQIETYKEHIMNTADVKQIVNSFAQEFLPKVQDKEVFGFQELEAELTEFLKQHETYETEEVQIEQVFVDNYLEAELYSLDETPLKGQSIVYRVKPDVAIQLLDGKLGPEELETF